MKEVQSTLQTEYCHPYVPCPSVSVPVSVTIGTAAKLTAGTYCRNSLQVLRAGPERLSFTKGRYLLTAGLQERLH